MGGRFVDAILGLEETLFPQLREFRITWKNFEDQQDVYLEECHAEMAHSHATLIHQKFRTPAREAAGIHFRCVIWIADPA
jgi:hypothetical protein